MNWNKVFQAGNVVREPELRWTQGAEPRAVLELSIAVNRRWKDGRGEQREETYFANCVAFGRKAEVMERYLAKGDPVFIEGYLKNDEWEDRETGKKRSKTRIVVEDFKFMPRGGRSEERGVRSEDAGAAAGTPRTESLTDDGPGDGTPF